ncbi:MAG: hypothetical protein ACYCS8_07700 [Acidithiobacillus sp.]|uniref:hypothetical protein n=1 Tax=Acidithiobacillus ferrooxidans TaxID=920 RepID=UPI000AF9FAFA|nr:hypothetical protein [Acidithiobacillus ferrooxidans]
MNIISRDIVLTIILVVCLMGLSMVTAHAGTMSICQAEGVLHGPQAASACRTNLRIYHARQVIHTCRTKVMEAEHQVYGQTQFHPVKLPKDCEAFTLMSSMSTVNYVSVPSR